MAAPLLVLAECTTEPCDIPREIPWWMGGVLVVVWLVAIAGVVLLARRRLALRAERRAAVTSPGRGDRPGLDSGSPGHDLEPW